MFDIYTNCTILLRRILIIHSRHVIVIYIAVIIIILLYIGQGVFTLIIQYDMVWMVLRGESANFDSTDVPYLCCPLLALDSLRDHTGPIPYPCRCVFSLLDFMDDVMIVCAMYVAGLSEFLYKFMPQPEELPMSTRWV